MNDIEDTKEKLQELESRFMMAYSKCKSAVGWPLVGQRPTQRGLSPEELDEDAKRVMDTWLVMLETQVIMWEKTESKLRKKYCHYSGEKKVSPDSVENGKSKETFFEPNRKLEI